ncbi:MAG: hypothetical protein BGN86_17055 [Caulobacterales bacterium 68-7]|nr:hypothetical protein [Caulobacterales bacterium]OJU10901.1 MAG: hypothetical protein BGN86_17055 [Caulobacterales bacterium 68-7]
MKTLFATRLYEATLAADRGFDDFIAELEDACRGVADDDEAGQAWCEAKGYAGYTSYASLNDLPRRASIFADLKKKLDRHAATFAEQLGFDLGGEKLVLDSIWINILEPGGAHSGHIHPHSVISGTVYVDIPDGASAIRFEDPRLPMMMAAPTRRADAAEDLQTFVSVSPQAGTVLMWESWLRHEVPANQAEAERISVSFNYGLK